MFGFACQAFAGEVKLKYRNIELLVCLLIFVFLASSLFVNDSENAKTINKLSGFLFFPFWIVVSRKLAVTIKGSR